MKIVKCWQVFCQQCSNQLSSSTTGTVAAYHALCESNCGENMIRCVSEYGMAFDAQEPNEVL